MKDDRNGIGIWCLSILVHYVLPFLLALAVVRFSGRFLGSHVPEPEIGKLFFLGVAAIFVGISMIVTNRIGNLPVFLRWHRCDGAEAVLVGKMCIVGGALFFALGMAFSIGA